MSAFKEVANANDVPSLAEAQAFVGGYVQVLLTKTGDALIVNDSGMVDGLGLNEAASRVMVESNGDGAYSRVYGPAILVPNHLRGDVW